MPNISRTDAYPRPPNAVHPALSFSLYFGCVFTAFGIFLPFWPFWLADRGIDPSDVALLLGVGTWVKVLSEPPLGHLADRFRTPRLIACICALASALGFVWAFFSSSLTTLLAAQLLTAACFPVLIPLGASQALRLQQQGRLDYARTRLWGSVGFILGLYGAGEAIEALAPDSLPLAIAVMLVTAALVSRLLPGAVTYELPRASRSRIGLALLRRRRLVLAIVTGACLQSSHAAYYAFSALHWNASGLGGRSISLLWIEGVVAEIALFWFGRRLLAWPGPMALLGLAAAGGLVRWTVLAFTSDLATLAAVQLLHGLTFGAAHLGAVVLVQKAAPKHLPATAQTLYTAASGCLMGLAFIAAGQLYDIEPGLAFWLAVALSAAGGLAALVLAQAGTSRR